MAFDDGPDRGRRGLLSLFPAAALAAVTVSVTGCGGGPGAADDGLPRFPLSEIPADGRLRVMVGELPVELRRTPDGVAARSLQCTHMGCEVRWQPETRQYRCPCHDGVFDAEGRVVAGPPPRNLDELPVVVEGDTVVVEV